MDFIYQFIGRFFMFVGFSQIDFLHTQNRIEALRRRKYGSVDKRRAGDMVHEKRYSQSGVEIGPAHDSKKLSGHTKFHCARKSGVGCDLTSNFIHFTPIGGGGEGVPPHLRFCQLEPMGLGENPLHSHLEFVLGDNNYWKRGKTNNKTPKAIW